MPESIREQLLSAIETQLDATYRESGRLDDDELPVIVFLDGNDTSTDDAYGQTNFVMPISVGSGEKSNSSDERVMRKRANELLAQIINQMFTDQTFGGLAETVQLTDSGILIEPGNRCMAEAQFNVRYSTLRGDPYAQE